MKKLILSILVALVSGQVFALDDSPFSGGEGIEHAPYLIMNSADLAQLAKDVSNGNSYEGKFFLINVETLDLSDYDNFKCIGNGSRSFQGILDGDGVVIKNLTITSSNDETGLFGRIGKNGIVKNITLDQTCILKGNDNTAAFCGVNYGTIDHCTSDGIVEGYEKVGGICGANYGILDYCTNNASVSGSSNYIGGITGYSTKTIQNCINNGAVKTEVYPIGGIVGYNKGGSVSECTNNSDNIVPGEGWNKAGGIVGYNEDGGTIVHCINNGNLTHTSSIGGIVGTSRKGYISYCNNTGNLQGGGNGQSAAGIIAWYQSGYGGITIDNCINTGNVTTLAICGGIGGSLSGNGSDSVFVYNCNNTGNITATGTSWTSGGIVASIEYALIRDCVNQGNIISNSSAGGVVGANHHSFVLNSNNEGEVNGKSSTGGIIGFWEYKGDVINCNNSGIIQSEGKGVGGIVGSVSYKGHQCRSNILNCDNYGAVTGTENVGGIVGKNELSDNRYQDTLIIENCINNNTVTGNQYVAGIIGKTNTSTTIIKKCSNEGEISGSSDYIAGICAYMTPRQYSNDEMGLFECVNNGNVIGKSHVGGILGKTNNNANYNPAYTVVQRCLNIGNIEGANYVGGIGCEMLYEGTKCLFKENKNKGNVKGDNNYIGALFCESWNSNKNAGFANNYYYSDVVVTIGDTEYKGTTPRGVGSSASPKDVEENDAAVMKGNNPIITFVDPVVKAICVERWDTDGDGELSEAEAAAVENLNGVFKNNQNIISFDELQYFTSLTSINGDFYGCSKLTSIIIPNNVTGLYSDGWRNAFEWCYDLTSVTLGDKVEIIGQSSFQGCSSLSSINFPSGLKSIGTEAFYGCSALPSLIIPSSVENIDNNAFCFCSGLNSIVVEKGNQYYDSRDNCNALIRTQYNELMVGSSNAFIPSTVTSIDSRAFWGRRGLTSLIIPKSVTNIGYGAFDWCGGLNSIIVEEGNPTYDSRNYCNALIKTANDSLISGSNNTTIPQSVKKIAPYAFAGCTGLTSLTIPSSIMSIGEYAFSGCAGPNLLSIVVEEGNTVYDSHNDCNAIIETATSSLLFGCKNTIILDDVMVIGPAAFRGCTEMTSIRIPNSVKSIEESAFYECSGLSSVVIGRSVEMIGAMAFYCPNLQDVYCYAENVPNAWGQYGNDAFRYSNIESATLHVPASSIGTYSADDIWKKFGSIVALEDSDPKPTGITNVNKNMEVNQQYYSLDGKRIASPQRGMNIVKMSDGTTRKVVVK